MQNNLPHAEIIETSSNARSAERAAAEPSSAAIAGALAAERYELEILESDIQDMAHNLFFGKSYLQKGGEVFSSHNKVHILQIDEAYT